MSSCAVRRWGPGNCKERLINTAAYNELTTKLEQMKNQRDADMQLWSSSSKPDSIDVSQTRVFTTSMSHNSSC